MDISAIGAWAGQHGPWLAVILAQWQVIRVLLSRLLAQQDIVIKAMIVTQRNSEVAERSTEVVAKVVAEK